MHGPADAAAADTNGRSEPFASALDTRAQAIEARVQAQALRRVAANLRAQRQRLNGAHETRPRPSGLSGMLLAFHPKPIDETPFGNGNGNGDCKGNKSANDSS